MVNLNTFMNSGIKSIAQTASRFYLHDVHGQYFMVKTINHLRKASKTRAKYEAQGIHVPPFLISSITSDCNLHCTGCYARANGIVESKQSPFDMTTSDWERVFTEATELGISFNLLAGGEPLMRRDVIETAAKFDSLIFPIFTNGTMFSESYLALFAKHRHLIPVLSIEGDQTETDLRRGTGVFKKVATALDTFKEKGILFGLSITVTAENEAEVTDPLFVSELREKGCGLIFYVEYVPVAAGNDQLVLDGTNLQAFQQRVVTLKRAKENQGLILLSFPGDEEQMGGCLAAGRGFFHINRNGGAEPCPFSPFSELNVKQQSILEVLQSPFFARVRDISAKEFLTHAGGCTLFENEKKVLAAVDKKS
jgi:MoaA/NifB/PqqE/SkfB family radical SAM enzyme